MPYRTFDVKNHVIFRHLASSFFRDFIRIVSVLNLGLGKSIPGGRPIIMDGWDKIKGIRHKANLQKRIKGRMGSDKLAFPTCR